MPAIFEYHLTVTEDEIDGQGHVNNLEYLKWMQDAAVAHSAEQGWTTQRYRDLGSGWVARTHTIDYLQPAFAGENIVVKTWISNFKKVTSLRKYKIIRPADAAVLATAETNWAFIGLERYIPRRIPQELFESFDLVGPESEPV
ncbi:MAG: acyl-CoA thioesterase [Planctomycetes bacterium]|nr:acyl-CoA thioesterase [Planctomycetota bacterium]